jgi:SAM-dependent methyltransferase
MTKTTPSDRVHANEVETTVRAVRERYGAIALTGGGCCSPQSGCCGPAPEREIALSIGYTPRDLELLPDGANLGLGCGAPIAPLELRPGETVVDLGSGAGVDAILAARAVGPGGRVIGVDMTNEMIERARNNAAAAGLEQVEFRLGRLESLPVDSDSVDAVTSNCVINLVPDKQAVFGEIHRVLRPGGRLVISDVVLDGALPEAIRGDLLAYVGCVAGAVERGAYFDMLATAGLADVEVLYDVDFMAAFGDQPPEEVRTVLDRAGLVASDVRGLVRSVTFRARKAAPESET